MKVKSHVRRALMSLCIAATASPVVARDFLDLELRWLKLARSYEVSERFKTFSGARFKGPEAVR